MARLGAMKDAGPRLRWDPSQAGEGGSDSGSRSGAGVSEPGRSRPKRSPGRQPTPVRQPEKSRGFSEARGAPAKQQGRSHVAWPRTKAARLLPEQGRSTASEARPGTLPRTAPGLWTRSSFLEQTSEALGMDFFFFLLQDRLYSTSAQARGSSSARRTAAGAFTRARRPRCGTAGEQRKPPAEQSARLPRPEKLSRILCKWPRNR